MARKALKIKAEKEPKFSTRKYTRCKICGRSRLFTETLGFVVCVCVNLLTRVPFQV